MYDLFEFLCYDYCVSLENSVCVWEGGGASMAQWMTTNGVIKVSPLYKYSRTSL